MPRKFIASVAALAVAITAIGSAPARADDQDVARALATILGLAVIGAAINDRNDRRERHGQIVTRQHQPHHTYHQPRSRQEYHAPRPRHGYHGNPQRPRPLPHRVNRKLLPNGCFLSLKRRNGEKVRMFGKLCLETHYAHAASLPRECRTRVRTHQGKRVGYEARCLRDRGYRLARR